MEHLSQIRTLLLEKGIREGRDYIFSLQGPTIIGTSIGNKKFKSLETPVLEEIRSTGIDLMVG